MNAALIQSLSLMIGLKYLVRLSLLSMVFFFHHLLFSLSALFYTVYFIFICLLLIIEGGNHEIVVYDLSPDIDPDSIRIMGGVGNATIVEVSYF